jgi:hypothetical protein
LLKFCENGRRFSRLRTLLRAHQFLDFLINSKINMIDFVNLRKVIVRKSAFSTFLSVWNESENKILKKTMKEKKKGKRKEKRSKVNLIFLMCQSHFFFLLVSQIGPQAFKRTHCTFLIKKSIWKRVQFKVQFASNWSLGFWSSDPCLKWPSAPPTYNGGINQDWKWWWNVLKINFHASNKNAQGSLNFLGGGG